MKLELKQLEIFICILNENCFLVIILNKTFWHKNNLESNSRVLCESGSLLNTLMVSLNYTYLWKISLRTIHLNLGGKWKERWGERIDLIKKFYQENTWNLLLKKFNIPGSQEKNISIFFEYFILVLTAVWPTCRVKVKFWTRVKRHRLFF